MRAYFGNPQILLGQPRTLAGLHRERLTCSAPEILRSFGYEHNAVSDISAYDMAKSVAERVLTDDQIHELYYDACFAENANVSKPNGNGERVLMENFMNYPAMNLCNDLGLKQLKYYGLSQQGCSGLFGCIALALRALMYGAASPRTALCITSERIPDHCFYDRPSQRLLHSDAASGCLVSTKPLAYEVLSLVSTSITNNNMKMPQLLLAFAALTKQALTEGKVPADQIENVFTPNFWPDFWARLVSLLGIVPDSLVLDRMKHSAHAFSSDLPINLIERETSGRVHVGHLQLAYGYGYGNHLYCLLFRKTDHRDV